MATLRGIAALAGVHVGTVAVVLNGAKGNTRVGAETREKVLNAARKLGYVRNESASRLKTGRSNAVGFVGGDLRNPFFAELAALLEAELEKHGLRMVISHVSPSSGEALADTVEFLRRETIQKIIYWDETDAPTPKAAKSEVSLLPIGFTTRPKPGIWLDLEGAIRLSLAALLERGLSRFGFYGPLEKRESPSVILRRNAFLAECRRLRLPTPVCATYAGESWNVEEAAKGGRPAILDHPEVEAFLGFNDVSALGLLMGDVPLRRKPLVVCSDGTSLTRCWPGKTLVLDLQSRELARQAVCIMVGEVKLGPSGDRESWLRPTLFS